MSDDVTITVRVGDHTAAGFRDIDGRIRSLDGRFATSAGSMQRSSSKADAAISGLKSTLLSLAPAAVPVAASLAPIAVQAGAATLAVAAFGAAVIPQIGNLKDASAAQTKYNDAVAKYGAGSRQAGQAQQATAQVLGAMPKATARAAVGWMTLKDTFSDFSDSTAKFTMAPVEKSFAVMGQIVPKLAPMVKGTSEQLDRLMTLAGGGVATGAFDTLSEKVGTFANSTLKGATDKAVHFIRVLSEGNATGPIAAFMDYARANGPATKELITNLSEAISNLLEGASQAGPGLLTLVNAMAKLVAAVPPSMIANLMQVYAAFKLIKLAGSGVGAIAGSFATLSGRVTALRAASVAAGGGIAGMNAALNTLSTGGKAALALGVVGALSLAMHELSNNKAPVQVDELSTALNTLATKGKVTGALKTNFDEISQSIAMVSKGASDNGLATMVSDFGTWVGISTGPGISDAKKNLDAWDKSMANLVRAGKPKEAAAQYEILKKAWLAGGGSMDRLKKTINDYTDAQADSKFEQQMAAESMGVFGKAALDTKATLDAQKQSADGLRESILALNDVNRSAYDSQIAFEAGIDNLSEAFKKNGATLDIHTEKGRANGQAMSQAAKAQDEMIASGIAAGDSLSSMTKKSGELRGEMLKLATEAFDGNKKKATEYVNTLLGAPSEIKTLVRLEREEAVAGLKEVEAAIRKTPGAKKITVDTLNGAAIKALEAVGFKTKQLPNGRTQVFTANGKSLGSIAAVARALRALDGKTATTWTYHNIKTNYSTSHSVSGGKSVHDMVGATGGLYTGKGSGFRYADGGPVKGPGTGTSDDVPAPWLSNGEFVIKAAAVAKYGEKFLHTVNDGQYERGQGFAKGGKVTKAQQRAKAQAAAEKEARADLRDQFGISHFGVKAGYQRTPFEKGLGGAEDMGALVTALNAARGNIKRSTHGGTESRLLKQLDSVGKAMIKQERQLTAVNKSLATAKDKLNDLKSAASSLSSSVRGGVLSASNITKGASGDAPVTVASLMSGATQSRDKAKSFAGALAALKKKGLDKGLIEDIANAGIDGGGLETAGALMGASKSEIKSMNTLRSQTAKYAKQAGGTAADAVYGAAIKAQTAAVSKLQKSQDKLEKSMAHLAKVMEKSISKAIGKKAAGGIVGAAAAGGIRSGMTWVGEHEPELLDLPVGSRVWSGPDSRRKARAPWESMLNTPRGGSQRASAPAASGGVGGTAPLVLNIALGGREFGQVWVDVGRNEVRTRGGLKATLGGLD
ncbi:phage tail protein [Streptomyces sp. NPDC005302]|uniref:phage tail protein n=1 Tax=Streptomyces sp. NPDC005302 TaxID=3154675 RepID=UPI0033A3D5E1